MVLIFTRPVYLYCSILFLLMIYALPLLLYYAGVRVIPVKTNFSQDITNCFKLIVTALLGLLCIALGMAFTGTVFMIFYGMQTLPLFVGANLFPALGGLILAVAFTYLEAKFLGSYRVVGKNKYNELMNLEKKS